MPVYGSSHLISCQKLPVCGNVGRSIQRRVHNDMIALSVMAQDLKLDIAMCYLRMKYHIQILVTVISVKIWHVGAEKWHVGAEKLEDGNLESWLLGGPPPPRLKNLS